MFAEATPNGAEFAAELEAHRSGLCGHCRRFVHDRDAAEDLAQEAIIRAWRSRASFEGRSALRTWLYRIATNACLDALRRDRNTCQVDPADFDSSPELNSSCELVDRLDDVVVAQSAAEADLHAAIGDLSPRQRTVLILRDGFGWSARDTAVAIDATVAAANSALQRARATARLNAEVICGAAGAG